MKELDVKNLLTKVRNSDAIINGLVRKDYLHSLKYHKSRVIAAKMPTDSSGDNLSSEGER